MTDTDTTTTTPDPEWVHAARAALDLHDELQRVGELGDDFELGADDLPIDSRGWLAWHVEQYKPAYRDWTTAMDRLRDLLGERFPGRHPLSFKPVCEQIIAAAAGLSRDRFTDEEWALFRTGRCSWVTEYGTVPGRIVHCAQPLAAATRYGYCPRHERQARDEDGGAR
jgi:hypothetical protein